MWRIVVGFVNVKTDASRFGTGAMKIERFDTELNEMPDRGHVEYMGVYRCEVDAMHVEKVDKFSPVWPKTTMKFMRLCISKGDRDSLWSHCFLKCLIPVHSCDIVSKSRVSSINLQLL